MTAGVNRQRVEAGGGERLVGVATLDLQSAPRTKVFSEAVDWAFMVSPSR